MGIIEKGQEVMKEFKSARPGRRPPRGSAGGRAFRGRPLRETWAAELGLNQAVKLLGTTLGEEKKTDETLTKIAQSE